MRQLRSTHIAGTYKTWYDEVLVRQPVQHLCYVSVQLDLLWIFVSRARGLENELPLAPLLSVEEDGLDTVFVFRNMGAD